MSNVILREQYAKNVVEEKKVSDRAMSWKLKVMILSVVMANNLAVRWKRKENSEAS